MAGTVRKNVIFTSTQILTILTIVKPFEALIRGVMHAATCKEEAIMKRDHGRHVSISKVAQKHRYVDKVTVEIL